MEIPYVVTPRKDTGLFNSKIAIWLFLASEVMLFGGFFSAYVFLRLGADFPWPERTALLCSFERFPAIWDFSAALAKNPFLRLPAAASDLLIASTAPLLPVGAELEGLLHDGGPAVLGGLVERVSGKSPASGAVVEVL